MKHRIKGIINSKSFSRKIADTMSFIEESLSANQKEKLKNFLSPKQKELIKRLLFPSKNHALKQLEKIKCKLYSLGFEERAVEDLFILYDKNDNSFVRRKIAWEIALWFSKKGTKEAAQECIKHLNIVKKGSDSPKLLNDIAIVEAESLLILGERNEAINVIKQRLENDNDANLYFSKANAIEDIEGKNLYINRGLEIYGLSGISLRKWNELNASREHLQKVHLTDKNMDTNIVSIIISTKNDANNITAVLSSVIVQTWKFLEIIVVDQNSVDETVLIVEEFRKKDDRIKLLQLNSDTTEYMAKNEALKIATGDFVTVVNIGEWSHPERIEKQVKPLLHNDTLVGTVSQFLLLNDNLRIERNDSKYTSFNDSSLMFRRERVMSKIGYWDNVNYGADLEFTSRIVKVFGEESVLSLNESPLSFWMFNNKESVKWKIPFCNRGYIYGGLKEYKESYQYFHENAKSLYYDFTQSKRPFPVPDSFLLPKGRQEKKHFDVILVSDFRLVGGSTISNIEEIKAQKSMGIKTGLIQMARYDVDPTKVINNKVRDEVDGENVQFLVFNEDVSCDVLLIRYPPILHELQMYIPKVKAKDIRVIINQPPMSDYGENPVLRYTLPQAQKHLEAYFRNTGIWHPIGPLVREALFEHHEAELSVITLSEMDWSNIINVPEWKRSSRPTNSGKVRIGRHSRDHEVKWPIGKREFLSIYPDSNKYEIYILGGARTPQRVLGYRPNNWKVYDFGQLHPKEFLKELDVFVYYTHPAWVESFGRVIIEAMATGVPVILPPSYKELFNEAAIYAEPMEVLTYVDKLMEDEKYYEIQVEKAYQYVEENFGYTKHATRLRISRSL